MQRERARISVIIPTLEEEAYIEAILSKLKAVKPSVEIVVVDGGSHDKTVELARRFAKKVFQTVKSGIAAGRNYGATKANGDILVFMDTDVRFRGNLFEKVQNAFNDPIVVGATCNIMPFSNKPAENAFFAFYNQLIRFTAPFKPHSRGEFLAVRKTAFESVHGFDESMPCLEDHDLANRIAKFGKFVFISDLTVYESMRRFRKLGFKRVIGTWFIDYVAFVIRGKPVSATWKPVR